MKHSPASPLPWSTTDTCSNNLFSVLERGSVSSDCPRIDIGNVQDAAFIVHSANAYGPLVEALRNVLPGAKSMGWSDAEKIEALLRSLGEAE